VRNAKCESIRSGGEYERNSTGVAVRRQIEHLASRMNIHLTTAQRHRGNPMSIQPIRIEAAVADGADRLAADRFHRGLGQLYALMLWIDEERLVIEPAVNANYTFNGCIIASAVCGPPSQIPITPITQIPIQIPNSAVTSALGGLAPFLPGTPPPLATLPRLVLIALPVLPAIAPRLTNPDVVPPNISYLDY